MQRNEEFSSPFDQKAILLLQIGFLLLLSLVYSYYRIFPTVEIVLGLTLAMLVWRAQHRRLALDLLPFFILLFSFQALRSFADNLTPLRIHITDLIGYEKALFGGVIPAHYLQTHLASQPVNLLIGPVCSMLYMSHFVIPVSLAIILWYRHKSYFHPFLIGLIALSYAGFFTYILYPAAPPWWATLYGYLPDQPVNMSTFAFPTLVEWAGPNHTAAMPSLHMAWPVYIALFCVFTWGKKVAWVFALPLCVGFATVYLGHHYVVDLLAGTVYALVTFFTLLAALKYLQRRGKITLPGR